MPVLFPLIEYGIAFLRFTNRVQHITIALAVHRLLKCLDRQTQVHLICSNVFSDIRQIRSLDTVQEYQEGQDLIISPALLRRAYLTFLNFKASGANIVNRLHPFFPCLQIQIQNSAEGVLIRNIKVHTLCLVNMPLPDAAGPHRPGLVY